MACAPIQIDAKAQGRQKRKTHDLQIITFGLQRAAGPYQQYLLPPTRFQCDMFRRTWV
jgi:hypothetical protein